MDYKVLMNQGDLTQLLVEYSDGQKQHADQIYAALYSHLKQKAHFLMDKESDGHTLVTTALVNEAFMKMINVNEISWQNRSHFISMAAKCMRRILIDHARAKKAQMRGDGEKPIEFMEELHTDDSSTNSVDVLQLNEALEKLAEKDSRMAEIVELKFFAGLNLDEISKQMDISVATIKRQWTMARTWLFKFMSEEQ